MRKVPGTRQNPAGNIKQRAENRIPDTRARRGRETTSRFKASFLLIFRNGNFMQFILNLLSDSSVVVNFSLKKIED